MASMNMNKTSEGEQELVLGNKQLLGIFFVVVALLGVFFSLGYIIGRNTANASSLGAAATPAPAPRNDNTPVDRPAERTAVSEPVTPSPVPESTHAAQAPAPTNTAETVTPTREPEATKTAPVEHHAAGATLKAIPEGQFYLQVAAVHRPDAENMVKVLRERGFPALTGESSKENLLRVLVGPYPDIGALHISKDELKHAGFNSIVAK